MGDSGANEKENVVGIWLFKTCWGKRYVAVGSGGGGSALPPDPPPSTRRSEVPVTSSVPPPADRGSSRKLRFQALMGREVGFGKKRIIGPFLR